MRNYRNEKGQTNAIVAEKRPWETCLGREIKHMGGKTNQTNTMIGKGITNSTEMCKSQIN